MIVINNYNQINKKKLIALIIMACITAVFLIVSITELNNDKQFYKSYDNVNGLIKNVSNKENNTIVRVSYKVKDDIYNKDFEIKNSEVGTLNIGDSMEIFYNKNNPSDSRIAAKSLASIIIIISILVVVFVLCIGYAIWYYTHIRTNIKLINNNNTIEAKFYRLEFRNSIIGNERINYVYCKGVLNGQKKIFKSIGFKNKPKPLNDKSTIKVYVDDKNNYLVNIVEIFE